MCLSWTGFVPSSVFFKLMVRPKFFAASERRLTMFCWASCVWARRAQSSATNSSVDGFRACEETPKVEETAVCSETDIDAVWQVSFVSRSLMLKKMENNVGTRTHPCLTPLELGKLPDKDSLCFIRPF